MQPTVFQPPQLYGNNGELIQDGAYGQETPFVDDHGGGWSDYVNNNLVYLNMVATGELVPVTSLPDAGVSNKKYVVTAGADAGKIYIWSGTEWLETFDAVSRAETAARQAITSQHAASESAETASESARSATAAATLANTSATAARSSATQAAVSEENAKEYAGQAMSGTPEGYSNIEKIIRGLIGYRVVVNPTDNGIDIGEESEFTEEGQNA